MLRSFLKKFGKKLADIRRARSLTQVEAAKRADISYRYLQSIESGSVNLTLATLLRLARPFKLNPAELLPNSQEWNWNKLK